MVPRLASAPSMQATVCPFGRRRRPPAPCAAAPRRPTARPAPSRAPPRRRIAAPISAARAGSSSMRSISRADPFVERGAQLGAVGAHLVELGVHRRQHAPRDRGAERPADQPAALLAHPLLDGGAQRSSLLASRVRSWPSTKPNTSWWRPPSTRLRSARATTRPAPGPPSDARHDAGDQRGGRGRPPRVASMRGSIAGERLGGGARRGGVGQEAAQDARQVEPAPARRRPRRR